MTQLKIFSYVIYEDGHDPLCNLFPHRKPQLYKRV